MKVGPLLLRHAQFKPVARAACRQHEVIGGADVAGGQFLGDQTGGKVVGHARATVFLLQHEGAETKLGALF